MIIRKKSISVSPDDLGLKASSQGWKLLAGAALTQGDLDQVLKRTNKTTDREREKWKVKKMVCDLNKKLKTSMGLMRNPINYQKGCGYKFNFNSMSHAELHGINISKGADAMEHLDDKELNTVMQSNRGACWNKDNDFDYEETDDFDNDEVYEDWNSQDRGRWGDEDDQKH